MHRFRSEIVQPTKLPKSMPGARPCSMPRACPKSRHACQKVNLRGPPHYQRVFFYSGCPAHPPPPSMWGFYNGPPRCQGQIVVVAATPLPLLLLLLLLLLRFFIAATPLAGFCFDSGPPDFQREILLLAATPLQSLPLPPPRFCFAGNRFVHPPPPSLFQLWFFLWPTALPKSNCCSGCHSTAEASPSSSSPPPPPPPLSRLLLFCWEQACPPSSTKPFFIVVPLRRPLLLLHSLQASALLGTGLSTLQSKMVFCGCHSTAEAFSRLLLCREQQDSHVFCFLFSNPT